MRLLLFLVLGLGLLLSFRLKRCGASAGAHNPVTAAPLPRSSPPFAAGKSVPWWTPEVVFIPQPTGEAAGSGPTRVFKYPPLRPADPRDTLIFQKKLAIAQGHTALPAQTLAVALSFLGTPYATGTLNKPRPEQLVINLRQLDCWTLVESSLAISLAAHSPAPDFTAFQHFVQDLRYWNSTIDGYSSRVHYFSAWLLQTEQLGYLRDLTQEFGGIPYRKKIGYMSARPSKYPALSDPHTMEDLRAMEARLNQQTWYYIPKARVAKMEHLLRDGDIVAITSWKRDLDIAHQGFAVKKKGRIYLLHASSLGRRVVLTAQPLAQYLASQKGQTGIMVARLVE